MSKMTKTIAALGVVAGLGVAALPLSSYAAQVTDTAELTVAAIVGDSISITADATDDKVTISNVTANQDVKEGATVLTIATNNTSGYKVTIQDKDHVTALTTDGSDEDNGIPAIGQAADLVKGGKGWGFKSSSTTEGVTVSTTAQAWRGVKENGETQQIASRASGASVTGGDKITLTFGVVVDSTVATGEYSDEVVLTATTNS